MVNISAITKPRNLTVQEIKRLRKVRKTEFKTMLDSCRVRMMQISKLHMEGYKNDEIAAMVKRDLVTISRYLKVFKYASDRDLQDYMNGNISLDKLFKHTKTVCRGMKEAGFTNADLIKRGYLKNKKFSV